MSMLIFNLISQYYIDSLLARYFLGLFLDLVGDVGLLTGDFSLALAEAIVF